MLTSVPRIFLTIATLAGWVVPLQASEEPLDVETYVQAVRRSHPASRKGSALAEAAEAERKAARLLPDPGLELGLDRARPAGQPLPSSGERELLLRQVLPWPAAFRAHVRAADLQADSLRSQAEATTWELEVEARRSFARLVSARQVADIQRSLEGDLHSLRDLVARRAELGETREADRLRAEVEWLRQERRLLAAEREAAVAEALLRALAVEPLPQPLTLKEPVPVPIALDRAALQRQVLERNPRLRAAQAEAQRAGALALAARRGRWPDLEVALFRQDGIEKKANGVSVGLKLPLWNANRGEIARAHGGAALAAAEAEQTRLGLLAELEASIKQVELAAAQRATLDQRIVPAALEGLSLARLSYEEGESSLLDMLDVQRTVREAQQEAVQARLALSLALADLQLLAGPPPAAGGDR